MNSYKTGSTEHVTVTVRANVLLDSQQVHISIDGGTTWLPATWMGDPANQRQARTVNAITFGPPRRGGVLVRVTDNTEEPIMEAGDFTVTPL